VLLRRDSAYGVRTAVTVASVTRTVHDTSLDYADVLLTGGVENADDTATILKVLATDQISTPCIERTREFRRGLPPAAEDDGLAPEDQ
jgi:hypothetical protein